jgi:hypothetical protein
MNRQLSKICAALIAFTVILHPSCLTFAQGSLTPPGALAPTMKTLAQIEPRTPISSAPFTISVAGSYYVTTNLTTASGDAITIAASGVTLDLGGWTITSASLSATGYGIQLGSGLHDLAIFNGHIASGVTNNGSGVSTGTGSGINVDTILSPDHGSYGAALNCVGTSAGSGTGLRAVAANNCTGTSGSGIGLSAGTATSCVGVSSGSGSIGLQAFSIAIGCIGNATSGGTGLTASIANSCVGTSFSVTSKYNMP